jgi:dipeptidyl-peptidase-4
MIKPTDFDASKKYPVLVYVYNGPNVQLINNRWNAGASLWMNYFAEQGYIIFTVDGRGSNNRGLKFEQSVFRQLGQLEMRDQLSGVDFLKKQPWVDADKMAIHGWSYGGFMTLSMMINYPDVFKVGVAGGPVTDWALYEVMYGERYMDTPETNPDGYAKTRVYDKTENITGKVLVIHGAIDPTVVPQHSHLFLQDCVNKGIQVDFFTYPGYEHNVRGKDRVHLMRKVLDYIEDNLN